MNQIDKVRGRTELLLDAFLGFKQKYLLVKPLIEDASVRARWLQSGSARGFVALRHYLVFSSAHDLAVLTSDQDDQSTSVYNVCNYLEKAEVVDVLRTDFQRGTIGEEVDAGLVPGRDDDKLPGFRAEVFEKLRSNILMQWSTLRDGERIQRLRTVRDKHTAHLEVTLGDEGYAFVNSTLEWQDLSVVTESVEPLILDMQRIVRSTHFQMSSANERFEANSQGLWLTNAS